jgi:hypothetical protein
MTKKRTKVIDKTDDKLNDILCIELNSYLITNHSGEVVHPFHRYLKVGSMITILMICENVLVVWQSMKVTQKRSTC